MKISVSIDGENFTLNYRKTKDKLVKYFVTEIPEKYQKDVGLTFIFWIENERAAYLLMSDRSQDIAQRIIQRINKNEEYHNRFN